MRFGDFLYTLRKEKGMTQTELADLLGVTNKAVSKWETGESYPETSLLVPIANVFGITVDELLRGERNTALEPAPEPEKPEPKVRQLKPMTKGEAFTLAGSVALILMGVLILITLSVNDIKYGIYVPVMLGCVAVAVFLIVFSSFNRRIRSAEMTEQNARKGRALGAALSAGIFTIIASVAMFIAMTGARVKINISLPVFFAVLILGISAVIYAGVQWGSFEKTYALPEEEQPVPARYKKLQEGLTSALMLSAVVVFLLLGFLKGLWHIAWVAFPVAAISCGIVTSILKALEK